MCIRDRSSSTPVAVPPPAPNMAPSFTSANTVDVSESVTGTAYSATASDADGNSLTYSISDSADAIHFSVDSSSGDVSFITPPDFENPSDSDLIIFTI